MLDWLFVIPLLPLTSAVCLALLHGRLTAGWVSVFGVGSMAIATILTALIGMEFYAAANPVFHQTLFTWLPLTDGPLNFALYLDQLSLVMLCVVTGVGFLIHWYAAAYMYNDPQIQRFFVYMNLFVFAMLILVLADNLVLLYLGWEGVGVCSFLLIGFWQYDAANVKAARKAFIVTRVGDTAMMIGLLILFVEFNSLDIALINQSSQPVSQSMVTLACLFLVGGAVGKSAQLPLQTWLPDAMAGPTPVSALIHAATMVTAGVYLIARMHPLFLLTPGTLTVVAWIGAITLVLAGFASLGQSDIKRILAYSTMSQIGYMFVGLGAAAFNSAIFHLMTHAFFKALLFLTAGSIIVKMHHQQSIYKMGGLFKTLPLTSTFLLIGLMALVAMPGTSGFFSKEAILASTWQAETTGPFLWLVAVFGTFLTSIYSFRLLFIVCFGPAKQEPQLTDFRMNSHFVLPLLPLVALALLGGYISINFDQVFPPQAAHHIDWKIEWAPVLIAAIGAVFAWFFYFPKAQPRQPTNGVYLFFQHGLGFDTLYRHCFVVPIELFSKVNKNDCVDLIYRFIAWFNLSVNEVVVLTQNGKLRWYLAATFAGTALMIGGLVWWN